MMAQTSEPVTPAEMVDQLQRVGFPPEAVPKNANGRVARQDDTRAADVDGLRTALARACMTCSAANALEPPYLHIYPW